MGQRRSLTLGLLVLLANACGPTGPTYRPEYDIVLRSVDVVPKDPARPPVVPGLFSFDDDWLRTRWLVSWQTLAVTVENASPAPLTVLWPEARFLAGDGKAYPLMRDDVPRESGGQALDPRSSEMMHFDVAEDVVRENGTPVGWKEVPLVPVMPGITSRDRARVEAHGRAQVGSSFTVELPVEASRAKRVYRLVFEVVKYYVAEVD
jgi:hypothetical protein